MAAILLVALLCSRVSIAYSVLTHEEIVDLVWTGDLRPLLLKRFPALTEEQLKEAHGYAYGGVRGSRTRTRKRFWMSGRSMPQQTNMSEFPFLRFLVDLRWREESH